MTNPLASRVELILNESLGELLAKPALRKNCALLGVSPEDLAESQLDSLAANLEKSVSFFCGDDAGIVAAARVRSLNA